MTAPFHAEFYAGDDNQLCVFGGNDDTQMLLFCSVSFNGVFWIRTAIGLALAVINRSLIQHFMNFLCRNMTAIHPASGMSGENQFSMPVKWFVIGS